MSIPFYLPITADVSRFAVRSLPSRRATSTSGGNPHSGRFFAVWTGHRDSSARY